MVPASGDVIREVSWWQSVDLTLYMLMALPSPKIQTFSDTYTTGWVVHVGDTKIKSTWNQEVHVFDIDILLLQWDNL